MVVSAILSGYKVEQQGYKSCLGLLKLADKYPPQRLEGACTRALTFTPRPSLKNIQAIPKAPLAHRALPGPGVYRFGFSRKASVLTRRRKETQRATFPPNLAPALMSLPSVALSSDASKSTFMVTPSSPLVNIQRRGNTAQSQRNRCSIWPVLMHSRGGILTSCVPSILEISRVFSSPFCHIVSQDDACWQV